MKKLNINISKLRSTIFKIIALLLTLLLPFLGFSLFKSNLANTDKTDHIIENIFKSENWKIVESSFPSGILWERTLTRNDALLSASTNNIAFFRGFVASDLSSGNRLISLNSLTGELEWTYSTQLVRGLIPSGDGGYFIVTCCTKIVRLDTKGQEQWESNNLPVKSFDPKIFIERKVIYFPVDTQTYVLSLDDGKFIQQITDRKIIGVYDNLEISSTYDRINVRSLGTLKQLTSILLSSEEQLSTFDIFNYSDILILSSESGDIVAYDILTGNRLWEINEERVSNISIDGKYMFLYKKINNIKIFDLTTGLDIGEIKLIRQGKAVPEDNSIDPTVRISASNKNIFVLYNETMELLALRISLD